MRTDILRIKVGDVKKGDVRCFDNSRFDVRIERLSTEQDGYVGIHANNDTWHEYQKPSDIVWIQR